MNIGILNTNEEFKSFPSNGKIILFSDTALNSVQLANSISIFRLIDESGLFNFGDKYNQSIGYVREEFSTIKYETLQEVYKGGYKLTLVPSEPLHPNSNYALFIDKSLSSEPVKIEKTVSKSSSMIRTEVLNSGLIKSKELKIVITSDPLIDEKTNLTSLSLTTSLEVKNYTINSKSKRNYFEFEGVKYLLEDKPYLKGETFSVVLADSTSSLDKNLVALVKTALSADTVQLDPNTSSGRVDYNSVLEYYKSKEENETTEEELKDSTYYVQEDGISYKYMGYNKVLIVLPSNLKTDDLDLDSVTFETSEAFDLYTLEQYGYYDPTKEYKLDLKIRDSRTLLLTVTEVE